jgi:hypothetical protein
MRYAHDGPKGFRLAFAFVRFILGVAHLSPIVVKDLGRGCISGGYSCEICCTNRLDLFESLRGFLSATCLDFWHDEGMRTESDPPLVDPQARHVPVHTQRPRHAGSTCNEASPFYFCLKTLSSRRADPTSESFLDSWNTASSIWGAHSSLTFPLWAS